METEKLLSVENALLRVLLGVTPPGTSHMLALEHCFGRRLSADLAALRTQPPVAVSAMDGYAVQSGDVVKIPARLAIVGESAAGCGFAGRVGPGQAVRIFTGAPVPEGADAVLVQERALAEGTQVIAQDSVPRGRNIRVAGLDFNTGDVLLRAGRRLGATELALAAAMNHASLPVARQPRVAILATGDELVRPGEIPGPGQIVASNSFAIAAYVTAAGGVPVDLGIAGDSLEALESGIARAQTESADILVTLGGASVGDHDLVKSALARQGMELDFWRIAMRPGKPLIFGRLGEMRILGLPGNPVSSIVCAILFLSPLIRALSGDRHPDADPTEPAVLAVDVGGNDMRQDYLRSALTPSADGAALVTPFGRQDSSMLRILADAECLLVRAPHAPPAKAGSPCRIIRLDHGMR